MIQIMIYRLIHYLNLYLIQNIIFYYMDSPIFFFDINLYMEYIFSLRWKPHNVDAEEFFLLN